MMISKSRWSLLALVSMASLGARDVILEFKGAYFLPTDCTFKSIYHHGSALFGPELTVQLCEERPWYAFVSVDYFQKKGKSVGLCTPTKVELIPFAFGLKYFFPVCCDEVNFYLGLGFQAIDVRTKNCSTSVVQSLSQWGFGGIAKGGVYWFLPRNFVLDFFVDYSFVKTHPSNCWCPNPGVAITRANVSGAIFGIGLGYNF